jgi:hypothetical protein
LLVAQIGAWLGGVVVIADPHVNIWIARFFAVCIPSLISLVALKVSARLASSESLPEVDKLAVITRRRRIAITRAIAFILLNIIPLYDFRATTLGGIIGDEEGRINSSAVRIHAAAVDASIAVGTLSNSLFDLVNTNHMSSALLWPIKSGELYTKTTFPPPGNQADLSEEVIKNHSQFEYFGKGISTESPPGTVIIVSKDIFEDGRRLILTTDDNGIWVSRTDFQAIRNQIESHQALSQEVLKQLSSKEYLLPYGE